jgi:hypothetical protein
MSFRYLCFFQAFILCTFYWNNLWSELVTEINSKLLQYLSKSLKVAFMEWIDYYHREVSCLCKSTFWGWYISCQEQTFKMTEHFIILEIFHDMLSKECFTIYHYVLVILVSYIRSVIFWLRISYALEVLKIKTSKLWRCFRTILRYKYFCWLKN